MIPAAWSSPQERLPIGRKRVRNITDCGAVFGADCNAVSGRLTITARNLVIFLILAHAFAQNSAATGVRDQLVFYVQALFAVLSFFFR